jgi:serine/threonine protein phosphatase 1
VSITDLKAGQFRAIVHKPIKTGRLLPSGRRIYVVGDIHGQLDLLQALSAEIERLEAVLDAAHTHEVFLGDYIDRGPASAGVIDWLAARTCSNRMRICLRGNHEWLMQAFIASPDAFEAWRSVGGGATLASYGISRHLQAERSALARMWREFLLKVPQEHVNFLSKLWQFYQAGDYFFVHAGLRPGLRLEAQTERDMLWIRSEFLDSNHDFGVTVVHGHSPARDVVFRPNRIGLDTGAYATGLLSCVMLERDEATVIQVRPAGL